MWEWASVVVHQLRTDTCNHLMGFLAPGFGQAELQLLQASGEQSNKGKDISILQIKL